MRDGFIRVACATPSIRVADCIFNAQAIAQLMESAAEKEARILVLPELSLSGYTCGDLFSQDILLQGALEGLDILLAKSRGLPLLTAVGMPLEVGGKLYNCAVFLYRGRVLGVVPKTHLPNYGEFYERRQFTPAPQEMQEIELLSQRCPFGTRILLDCSNFPGLRIGAEICEDLWAPCPPSIAHALAGATVILNLSASDETVGKQGYRRDLVCGQSARLVCGYL